jgi:hypothetical protein
LILRSQQLLQQQTRANNPHLHHQTDAHMGQIDLDEPIHDHQEKQIVILLVTSCGWMCSRARAMGSSVLIFSLLVAEPRPIARL